MASEQQIPDEVEEEATRWVVERDAGLSTDEQRTLHDWLAADPLHALAFARAEKVWEAMGRLPVKVEINRRRLQATTAPRPGYPPKSPRSGHSRWMGGALAACLTLAIIGTANDWPTRLRADVMTETGERREVPLEDGSVVQLNTGSAIAIDYGADHRIVHLLKGEASFAIVSDRKRPFTVEAGNGSTTALGTRFIVRRNGANTDIAVTEHSVRVAWPSPAKETVDVGEGQAVSYGPQGIAAPQAIDVNAVTSWTRDRLVFVDRPLGEVVAELARYHKGYIRVIGDDLARRRVSGIFRTDDPMNALDTLQHSLGIHATRISNGLVFLHS